MTRADVPFEGGAAGPADMRVTELKTTKRGRIAVFLDGAFAGSVDAETAAKNGLREGNILSGREFDELLAESNLRQAKEKAMRLLAMRDHAERELAQKLRPDFGEDAALAAAARMAELGLVNDAAYAKKLAAELMGHKGYSARRAAMEMTCRGLDRELVENTLAGLALNPDASALALLQKKYPYGLRDERETRRAAALLQRYGYGYDVIRRAMESYGDADQEED